MDFRTLPQGPLRLLNVTVPACLVDEPGDLTRIALTVDRGGISGGRRVPAAQAQSAGGS